MADLRFVLLTQPRISYKGHWVRMRYKDSFILVVSDPVKHSYWVLAVLTACMEGSVGLVEDLGNKALRFSHPISL